MALAALISRTVSVDVKHHVYLIYLAASAARPRKWAKDHGVILSNGRKAFLVRNAPDTQPVYKSSSPLATNAFWRCFGVSLNEFAARVSYLVL